MYSKFVEFVKSIYKTNDFVPLHAPVFNGNEKKYLLDCIDSTFVSSVGQYVNDVEIKLAEYTGAKYAVVTSNGTSALHVALVVAGVKQNDLVITQPLSFIATCNAISYIGAQPLFVDIDLETLGMCPDSLSRFLEQETKKENGVCIHTNTGKRITACVPMHTFGFPCKIDEIESICKKHNVTLVEDAAESIGSYYKGKHTGTFGAMGVLSFNGNKTITSGGGGAILTNDEKLAKRLKHLTTQAKVPHAWDFVHDEVGYNYRMPNINAALALAQIEQLDGFLESKRKVAERYIEFFKNSEIKFITEPKNSKSNYWLSAILLNDSKHRDEFLKFTNENKVMTRPVWRLMNKLEMFKNCIVFEGTNAQYIEDRLVNIPSSVTQN
ncbi:MAG: LegC family aminotransferase [Bacteroidota bacterium]